MRTMGWKSGLGFEVGRNISPRCFSIDIGAHTLAASAQRQVCVAGSTAGSRGIGSRVHSGAPVCASTARTRTLPEGAATRPLSLSDEPTITTPFATTDAEEIWNSPGHMT
jgi:hypothetical protein